VKRGVANEKVEKNVDRCMGQQLTGHCVTGEYGPAAKQSVEFSHCGSPEIDLSGL
jgi:hypothetical protein